MREDTTGVAEDLRIVLIVLAAVTLAIAILATFTDHDTSDAWSAFGAAFGLLAGQHLEKPKRRLLAPKTAPDEGAH